MIHMLRKIEKDKFSRVGIYFYDSRVRTVHRDEGLA